MTTINDKNMEEKEIEQEEIGKIEVDDKNKFWKLSSKDILAHFNQNLNGYSNEKADELLKENGLNELEEEEKESIWEKIAEQFEDNLVRILLAAATISFIIALTDGSEGGITAYIEPIVILLILIANGAIGIIQDINADNAIEALKKMQQCNALVYRNGEIVKLDSKYLVPGDLVQLTEGEKVPADIRLLDIKTVTFQVDQSAMTGETNPAYKDIDPINKDKIEIATMHNSVFSSTGVVTGTAIGIVTSTGMQTQIGKIQEMIKKGKEEEEKSPLKVKLEEFGDYLSYIIGVICLVVWIINFNNFFDEIHGGWISGCIYYFKISVALAVAAIPEGLPAVITTCLALGTTRLSKRNAIIRKLHSIETLGCTSIICSDKTGTLTTNNMTIKKFLMFDKPGNFSSSGIFEVEGSSFNPEGKIINYESDKFREVAARHNECSAINNMSKLVYENDKYSILGMPTEGALRVLTEKFAQYDNSFKNTDNQSKQPYNNYILNNFEIIYTLEFDRKRKAKSIIAFDKRTQKYVVFTKGAVEMVIKKASTYLTTNGLSDLKDNNKAELLELITEQFMKKSLRTLALCVKTELPQDLLNLNLRDVKQLNEYFKDNEKILDLETNNTLISVVGMLDPPRPEVSEAIEICHKAGIRVFMITGDERETAKSIGIQIGIIDKENADSSAFYAIDFFKKTEKEQLDILKNNPKLIFARSEPEHKQLLIKRLQYLRYVVAMTGDGTNDAPALSKSNIGIAMGISGTEVTKEASHMVLADDNFATIVKAVEEGRSIYMNMKAFIRYLISSNIGEVVSIFVSTMCGLPESFTSIQLLWVNLVTDGPPATALSFNPSEKKIMNKPPRGQ